MSLKELTRENHERAERQPFVDILMGGIDEETYATYLFNQFPQYELLELLSLPHGLFNDFPELQRKKRILEDFQELWPHDRKPYLCPTVKRYLDHLMTIKEDPHKLMAHIYVRHMGDLSGGQMISRKVPGQGRYYQFDNAKELKEKIRKKIDDSMADEAKICFDFATELFQDMMEQVDK